LGFIFFFSCKKDIIKNIDINLLSIGKWQFQKMQLTERNSLVSFYNIDTTYFPAKCDSDNLYVFEQSGSYVNYSGKLKCEAEKPDSSVGTWQFLKQKNELLIQNNPENAEIFVVDDLSQKEMILNEDTNVVKNKVSIVVRKVYYYTKVSK